MKKKITKNTLILEIAERYPQLVDILIEKYGFHCIGCSLSAVETLGEGAMAHGIDKKTIEKMVIELNKVIDKEAAKQKKK